MLVILSLSATVIALNCIFQRNRVLFCAAFVVLWILFVFSVGLPDEVNYTAHFNNEANVIDKGIGYLGIVQLFNALGLGYFGFKVFSGTALLLSISVCGWTLTRRPGLVIALYAIFPFCMDAVQLRFSLAFAIVLFGYIALREMASLGRSGVLLFVLACFVAATIHASALCFLVLLVAQKVTVEQALMLAGGAFLFLAAGIFTGGLPELLESIGVNKRYFSSNEFDLLAFLRLAVPALAWVIFGLIEGDNRGMAGASPAKEIVVINLLVLSLSPLVAIAPSLYRIETTLFVIYYILATRMLGAVSPGGFHADRKMTRVAYCIFCSVLGLSLMVLLSTNFGTVMVPLLSQNQLLT